MEKRIAEIINSFDLHSNLREVEKVNECAHAIATEIKPVRALTYAEVLNVLQIHASGGERIETMAGAIVKLQEEVK